MLVCSDVLQVCLSQTCNLVGTSRGGWVITHPPVAAQRSWTQTVLRRIAHVPESIAKGSSGKITRFLRREASARVMQILAQRDGLIRSIQSQGSCLSPVPWPWSPTLAGAFWWRPRPGLGMRWLQLRKLGLCNVTYYSNRLSPLERRLTNHKESDKPATIISTPRSALMETFAGNTKARATGLGGCRFKSARLRVMKLYHPEPGNIGLCA